MKSFFKISFVAMLLTITSHASAQLLPVSLGVKGGVNISTVDTKNYKSKAGFNAGLTLDINLPANLAIMSGVEVTTKGAKLKLDDNPSLTVNAMYLQVPIHLGYRVKLLPGISAHFDLGPYFAQGIGGKTKIDGEKFNTFGDNTFFENSSLKRFDWGLGIGVGVTFLGKIQTRAGYDHGLANAGNSDVKIKNRNAFLSVGWKFF